MASSATSSALTAWPIYGATAPTGDHGIRTSGDVLVDRTADGTDLNQVIGSAMEGPPSLCESGPGKRGPIYLPV
jgi:hypothetical protein